MDISQLRGSVDLWDKIMIISVVVTAVAVAATGASAWLSIKYNSALRVQESEALDRYKGEAVDHAANLERVVALTKIRTAMLEKNVVEADERATLATKRAADSEKLIADANARAEEAQRALERSKVPPASPEKQNSQVAASVAKHVGAAAIYVVDEAPDAAEASSSINAILTEAGWATSVWTWRGVSGIVGVVVLTKEGDDPATDRAAAGIVDTFRSAGFNAAKANWPSDWRRYQGTLFGPNTPGPTDAPVRIVIGMKTR
jgi:hypothetical protein